MDLLFELATWHALAKLRIHTNKTIDLLAMATKTLTITMRRFLRVTCEAFTTRELKKETAARGRRTAALAAKGDNRAAKGNTTTGQKIKKLNLATYKYHALADYAETIRRFGPTDNYNTQIVCLSISPDQYRLLSYLLGGAATSTGQDVLCQDKQEQRYTPDRKAPEARGHHAFHSIQGFI